MTDQIVRFWAVLLQKTKLCISNMHRHVFFEKLTWQKIGTSLRK